MGDRIDGIDEQIKRLKQRRAALMAKQTQRRRRLDARCKILIGAELLATARRGDIEAKRVYQDVLARLRKDERSRKTLDEWEAAAPASAEPGGKP